MRGGVERAKAKRHFRDIVGDLSRAVEKKPPPSNNFSYLNQYSPPPSPTREKSLFF
jgi:hypothetical protein